MYFTSSNYRSRPKIVKTVRKIRVTGAVVMDVEVNGVSVTGAIL